ncbi:zinc finger CCCH domain-containing protein 39-like [Impatiens glandulifera]|uniref:zinc finger CCCH domain-containing protein 39-like n=1 Tax=Impatiens glandulifera TaxID=253017 RepID=UPI001FB09FE2|nr:zinc finger CCCH domain-containing protein 39-like [Impatiens glandulifera]
MTEHNVGGSNSIRPETGTSKGNIFYKTRLCHEFAKGRCLISENCNYAHGYEDLMEPPLNWQETVYKKELEKALANWNDEENIVRRMNICRRFIYGGNRSCSNDNNCIFLHEHPSKFKVADVSMLMKTLTRERDDTVISIQNSDLVFPDRNIPINFWKIRLCTKWEMTRCCPYGDSCQFAHGLLELRKPGNGGSTREDVAAPAEEAVEKTGEVESWQTRWRKKLPRKIVGIYGDWIDGMSPPRE